MIITLFQNFLGVVKSEINLTLTMMVAKVAYLANNLILILPVIEKLEHAVNAVAMELLKLEMEKTIVYLIV